MGGGRRHGLSKVCLHAKLLQSCRTLCDLLDHSLLGRYFCLLDSPGENTGVSCHFLFQGIFQMQGSKVSHGSCIAGDSLWLSHPRMFSSVQEVHVLLKPGLENFSINLLACEMRAIAR